MTHPVVASLRVTVRGPQNDGTIGNQKAWLFNPLPLSLDFPSRRAFRQAGGSRIKGGRRRGCREAPSSNPFWFDAGSQGGNVQTSGAYCLQYIRTKKE